MKARLSAFLRGVAGVAQPWRPSDQPYPALADFDPRALAGQAGVYALWHLGVRPRWMRVGGAADLAVALVRVKGSAEIHTANAHGGVYVAWALMPAEEIPAVVAALAARTRGYLQSLDLPGDIRAAPPGTHAFPLPPGSRVPSEDESAARKRQE